MASLRAGTSRDLVHGSPKPINSSLSWESPPHPFYAVSSKADYAGIGVLVRNSAGDVMAASTFQVRFLGDVEFVEAITVQKGIQFATDIGLVPAIIESDSLNVVNLIGNKITNKCEVGWLISDIQGLTSSQNPIKVLFAP